MVPGSLFEVPPTLVLRRAFLGVAPISWNRPILGDQQSSFARRQVDSLTDVPPAQVHAVDVLGQLSGETHPHSRVGSQVICRP